jgi:aspartate/methionine/tyrosine aminotransferase
MTSQTQGCKNNLPAHIAFSQSIEADIVYNLSDSTAQTMTVSELCALGNNNIDELSLSYGALMGDDALRQAIATFHQDLNTPKKSPLYQPLAESSPENFFPVFPVLNEHNVLTFCGAQEALASVYRLLLQPGDEVVLMTPCYPSLKVMAENSGCVVREIKLSALTDWQVNIDSFLPLVNERTKLIVLNSPHNPSGSIIDSYLAAQLLSLAKQFNCYILADDVSQASNYHNLPLEHQYLSYSKAIIVSVLSKSFGLAGIRVGWVVCKDEELIKSLLADKCYGSICCSAVDLFLAKIALNHQQIIINKNNLITKNNIILFENFINKNSHLFSWYPPRAGMLAIVKCHFEQPIEQWAKHLASMTGLLLLPTSLFGMSGQYFRLGLGQANLFEALEVFQQYLDNTTG